MRREISFRQAQRGAVAITFGLTLLVLIGFLGLVLDLGQMFVTKTEVQNAMDACALAAAKELTGVQATQLQIAENAGLTIGNRNRVGFQGNDITLIPTDITFSEKLNGTYAPQSAIAAGDALKMKFARCTWARTGIAMYVMQTLGFGPQSVAATAVATLQPSITNCGIPLGLCKKPAPASCPPGMGSPGPYGHCKGDWVSGGFGAGGGLTGSFNWIDFTPPAGGESELAALLLGQGQCNLNVTDPVGESGVMGNAAAKAWNSRFGLYQSGAGNPKAETAPPDFTGYSYTDENWSKPLPAYPDFRDAYGGYGGQAGHFQSRRSEYASYGGSVDTVAAGNDITGLSITGAYNVTTHGSSGGHGTKGADRRLVTAPVVDCEAWASSQTVPILAWACVLMLHPISHPSDVVLLEYRGLSTDIDSPCAVSGLPAGPGGGGPMVPGLVQ